MGRNWQWSFDKGRKDRLAAELHASSRGSQVRKPELHSHDATMQSFYDNGWSSPSVSDIYGHIQYNHCKGREAFKQARSALCTKG